MEALEQEMQSALRAHYVLVKGRASRKRCRAALQDIERIQNQINAAKGA